MLGFGKKKEPVESPPPELAEDNGVVASDRPWLDRVMPVFATGSGLFSDGYINNVIGSVNTVLLAKYGKLYKHSTAYKFVADIAFVGTVVGQLTFGLMADSYSRTNTLVISTVILVVFTALAAGSYYHGSATGMFNMLTAWRFFVGIGIGGEYPAGSVSCAEASGEMKSGSRNRWFILFTNSMIDWGFVAGAFVPYVVAAACHNEHLSTIWRTSLGIGCVFPFILFLLRLRLKEPVEYQKNSMRRQTPYVHVIRYYWFRLICVSIVWFLYDFSVYAFGIYSSTILAGLYPSTAPLTTVFGWNTVINLFYIPGTLAGAFISDWIGPRYTLVIGVLIQSCIGYIMAGLYAKISQHVAAFAVVYGIFLTFGELGPGNNIGLIASKTCATGVRARYYGIAAAVGKIGAFVGTYAFTAIENAGHSATASAQNPFFVASSLNILSAAIVFFLIPHIGQDTITKEDHDFRVYLESKGWDTSLLGLAPTETMEEAPAPTMEKSS